MKKIKIFMEYGQYPIWELSDDGCLQDTIDAKELGLPDWLVEKTQQIQDNYNQLFIDNEVEFRYVGDECPDLLSKIKKEYIDISQSILHALANQYEVIVVPLSV